MKLVSILITVAMFAIAAPAAAEISCNTIDGERVATELDFYSLGNTLDIHRGEFRIVGESCVANVVSNVYHVTGMPSDVRFGSQEDAWQAFEMMRELKRSGLQTPENLAAVLEYVNRVEAFVDKLSAIDPPRSVSQP